MTADVQFLSIDRQLLRGMEDADAYAEACRQDWLRALDLPEDSGQSITLCVNQAARNYAEAANAAHLKRIAYADYCNAMLEADLKAERAMMGEEKE